MSYGLGLFHMILHAFLFHSSFSTNTANLAAIENELPQAHDYFQKYWPILEQFLLCTIYFSRSPNASLELHDSFLERCKNLGYCTAIQSSHTKPIPVTRQSVLEKLWNQTDFEHLSSTFWNIFAAHRYHSVCTIQLNFSYYDLVETKGDQWLFSAVSPYNNYIILPVDFELNSTHSPYVTGPSSATSKLICLNRKFSAIYFACLTCAEVISHKRSLGQFGYMFHKPLTKLGSSQISKHEFDEIWNYYHSNKNNLLKKSNHVTKIANLYNDPAYANYLIKHTNSLSLNLDCYTNIIKAFFNFSQFTNQDTVFWPFEDFAKHFIFKRRHLTKGFLYLLQQLCLRLF